MPPKTMEERITDLEQKMARLLGEPPQAEPKMEEVQDLEHLPAWLQKHIGAFKNDPYFDAAMEAGAAYRRSQPTGEEDYDAEEAQRRKVEKTNAPA